MASISIAFCCSFVLRWINSFKKTAQTHIKEHIYLPKHVRGYSRKTTCKITHGTRNAAPFIAGNLFWLYRLPDYFSMAPATIKALPLSSSQPFGRMTHSGLPGDALNHQEKCHPLICVGLCGRSESAGTCKRSSNDPSRSVITKYAADSHICWAVLKKPSLQTRRREADSVFADHVISQSTLAASKPLLKFL